MKQVAFGQDARERVLAGINDLSRMVVSTFGPAGQCVMIGEPNHAKVIRDGVSVAESISFKDPYKDFGARLAKQVARKTVSLTGDGTTGSICLFDFLATAGHQLVRAGTEPNQLKREMEDALEMILEEITNSTHKIDSYEEVKQIATISLNNDEELGKLVADAFAAINNNGTITLEDSRGPETNYKVSPGFEMPNGFQHRAFINDPANQRCIFKNPFIWTINSAVYSKDHLNDMLPVLQYVIDKDRPLVIFAEDINEDVLTTLVSNVLQKRIKCCAVRAAGHGDLRRSGMDDLAALVGAHIRDVSLGDDLLKNIDVAELGSAEQVEVYIDRTVIVGKKGVDFTEHLGSLKAQLKTTDKPWDQHLLEKRVASLTGGVCVISVGGQSEVEQQERKLRLEDAVGACKAALSEGVVLGGGVALLKAKRVFDRVYDKTAGMKLLQRACSAPFMQILKNAGFDDKTIFSIMVSIENSVGNFGYDAATMEETDLMFRGIIDPALTIKSALKNAVSVAAMFINTSGAIVPE